MKVIIDHQDPELFEIQHEILSIRDQILNTSHHASLTVLQRDQLTIAAKRLWTLAEEAPKFRETKISYGYCKEPMCFLQPTTQCDREICGRVK